VSTALACGRIIAEGIAMLPTKIMQQQPNAKRIAREHPLHDLLAVAPNPLQTAFEFFETLALHLAFTGNAYVYRETISRRIDALYLLDPKQVRIAYRWPESPQYEVRLDDGRVLQLSAGEIWHVRGPSWCAFKGFDPLDAAREALGLSLAIEEGQARIQSQGVRMPGFIAVDRTLSEEQHAKLTGWIARQAGASNAGRVQVLDSAAKFMATAMSNADAQMIDMRKFQVEEVCRYFRVMPIMVGYSDKTATYASAEQMFLAHMVHTIGPWLRRLEQSIDKNLLSREDRAAGYFAAINEKAALRMTAMDQSNMLRGLVLGGILTQNEARDVLDYNPLTGQETGHDALLNPVNMVAGEPMTVSDLNSRAAA
jgi:HK97 family phage portal protein